jgi:hypothetical protein
MDNPMTSQLIAAKRILKYVKGTAGFGILHGTNQDKLEPEMYGYEAILTQIVVVT